MKKARDFLAKLRQKGAFTVQEIKERTGHYGPKGPKQKAKRKKK